MRFPPDPDKCAARKGWQGGRGGAFFFSAGLDPAAHLAAAEMTRASLTRGTGAARKILFDKAANCDNQNIMKVASVADLRNNFASVSRWIYEGESVAIQKRGKAFAVLAPAEKKRKKPVEWPDYEARLQRIYGGRTPTGATAAELVDYMRGEY